MLRFGERRFSPATPWLASALLSIAIPVPTLPHSVRFSVAASASACGYEVPNPVPAAWPSIGARGCRLQQTHCPFSK